MSMTRWIAIIVGALYALSGVAMLLAPQWFFDNIGTFPPFNRHFLGDLGAFSLAIGLGLLLGARAKAYLPGALLVGGLASLVHVLNHVYDAAAATVPGRGWSDVPGLTLVFLLVVSVPLWQWRTRSSTRQAS